MRPHVFHTSPRMKIIVCVKQVPFIGDLRFDLGRRRIVREGTTLVLNAYDRPAVVAAVETARAWGGEVVVMTMGPPSARDALVECLAIGADRAIHLCDPALGGADSLTTARALAAAIRRDGGADLIWAGRSSTDANTGHVGPMIAELLDLPQATGVTRFDVARDLRTLIAEREIDGGHETVELSLPAVLTAAERLRPPPVLPPGDRARAEAKPIEVVTAAGLGLPARQAGEAGSPTWIEEIYSVAVPRQSRVIDGADPELAARELAQELVSRGLFERAEPDSDDVSWPDPPIT
ncbi:MAG TPA: electron transfer flavoprotein subunit beta/FixA family protein, partial [Dehalococcoidia bacterium]|nr:electron transfer flavoprotein subunit beta/FixA family protein [Dehalococcoidia bacterium]